MSKRTQRTATLDIDWKDLTKRHETVREDVEKNIDMYPNQPVGATYIIGAIGAGKSLLLLHALKYSWKEAKKPAIYLDLSDIVDKLSERAEADGREVISQAMLQNYLEEICIDNLRQIQDKIEKSEPFGREIYLPETRRGGTTPEEYFSNLGVGSPDEIAQNENELVVIVDEMEEAYQRLDDKVEGKTGPLREVVDKIEKGNSKFYMIGAFGYASANELGQAEARRVESLNLPIIRPRHVGNILGEDFEPGVENYAWWFSRGRPGWLHAALDSKKNLGDEIDGLYSRLFDISSQKISRVDVLDRDGIDSYVGESDPATQDLVAYLLTDLSPHQIGQFDETAKYKSLIKSEAADYILCDTELTSVEEVFKTVQNGLESHDSYNSDVSDSQLSQFGQRVLQGMSNAENEIVFGHNASASPAQPDRAVDMVLRPLARRMHDIALEELNKDDEETIEFLYDVTQYVDENDAEDIYQEFDAFFELFSTDDEITVDSYISASLKIPSISFPSLITNPRLSFADQKTSIEDQYDELVEVLDNIKEGPDRLLEFGEILQEDPR
jgi:hypothetical protein